MLLKKITYWNGKKWMPLNIKTDSLHIETAKHNIDVVTDGDVKKVEILSKTGSVNSQINKRVQMVISYGKRNSWWKKRKKGRDRR